jgi:hypothetical protein
MMVDKTRVIELLRQRMKSMGHNNAPGCVCCINAQMLIEALEDAYPEPRVIGGVIVSGPTS